MRGCWRAHPGPIRRRVKSVRDSLGGPVFVGSWLALSLLMAGCGESSANSSTGPSSVGGHTFELTNAEGKRWAQSGNYLYDISYRLTNGSGGATTYSLRDYTVLGPAGETLSGYTAIPPAGPVTLEPNATIRSGSFSLNGGNPGHPYAERVRIRMNFRTSNGTNGILGDEEVVLHGPQTARLHDFSMSPPGMPPESVGNTSRVTLGEPVIVRWNVEGASIVVLESTIPIPPGGGPRFAEEVEHVGSRTFTTLREGLQSATLDVDRGRIRILLLIGVQR